ncbi:MAG TPA: histidinol-phosphate transaminase [Xanthomonadales bacterium]|nr:histidinol-phosphate transaminase [Xanthomonadales bacterium]
MSILARARPELLRFAGYSSARMEAHGGRVFLNANESPWSGAGDATAQLQRYPEPQPPRLRAQLAACLDVAADSVLVTRGSDEGIDLLTRAFCAAGRDAVVVAPPTFGMYAVAAAVQGVAVVEVALAPDTFAYPFDAVAAACGEPVKLVYVCTPNNPTGTTSARADVLALADTLRDRALVVADEAYVEFADGPSLCGDVRQTPNLVVLRTLSKAHALAGARVGALVAAADVVDLLRRIMAPYPLAAPCIAAAEAALAPTALEATQLRVAAIRAERARVARALAALRGVRAVLPSQANFLAVRLDDPASAYRELLARGIVVRDLARYPGLGDALRMTIGRPEENDALLDVLTAWGRRTASVSGVSRGAAA